MEELLGFIGVSCLICLVVVVIFSVVPFIVMVLWNAVVPQVFGLPPLNFFMAFCLVLLLQILLNGIKVRIGK